ncbi:DNA polymerase III subunit chi [Methylopila jiangsuensis]|uniref:DNA polymerase III subunit chi n=1 Tax=Methylopila jiangsuensis TaxID=586230 RepID=A0A9W6JJQ6_9HYPH|nr:DNA polymerase III subunit chi [Methylopila jiangsuensis]MDR6286540.1 DNA polymerase-3 subunit chi [Methylopila jiangsuensis]GLK77120.1 DNA polymerase III subunit chi [Methylopila jiangsuensis]
MTEILFYHLTSQPLARALPALLEKCLERKWKVVVQATGDERVAALDAALWTYADDSFLPHGAGQDGADEPVWLTATDQNPNAAAVRVLVDGAPPPALEGYQRALVLFDGADPDALEAARAQWKALKAAGHDLTYWRQDEDGRWRRQA